MLLIDHPLQLVRQHPHLHGTQQHVSARAQQLLFTAAAPTLAVSRGAGVQRAGEAHLLLERTNLRAAGVQKKFNLHVRLCQSLARPLRTVSAYQNSPNVFILPKAEQWRAVHLGFALPTDLQRAREEVSGHLHIYVCDICIYKYV